MQNIRALKIALSKQRQLFLETGYPTTSNSHIIKLN